MLFSTHLFLLVFLPSALGAYFLAARRRSRFGDDTRKWLLVGFSLGFYAYWDIRLLPLLVFSILANWILVRCYRFGGRYVVALGVALNLLVLGVFKYADFFADTIAFLLGEQRQPWNIVLPLAISFFTFQQISYLIDLRRGSAPACRLVDYALYVSFFPQLIAGPIVRHHEIIPQFQLDAFRDGLGERFGRGLAFLLMGLSKKVCLADPLSRTADHYFTLAGQGDPLTFGEAWLATFSYTFQLYFDFSGYTDMAIGMALMFGFTLPLNFDSPYRAGSIRDFWRRWHMTLTRFMRDYVYVPLGRRLPRRHRTLREAIAAVFTMILIGAWHGAAWSYVVFGAMHGIALVVNQVWNRNGRRMPGIVGWFVTFVFFAVTLVLFRSESFGVSLEMWSTMIGQAGMNLTAPWLNDRSIGILVVAAAVAFLAPNSQQIVFHSIVPQRRYAIAAGVAAVALLLQTGLRESVSFIYFQF